MKLGKKEWRRVLFAAWTVFAVSFLLPAYIEGRPGPPSSDDSAVSGVAGDAEPGWGAFLNALIFGDRTGKVSALTNLLMLFSLATLRTRWTRRRLVGGRWLPLVLGAAGVLNLLYWPIWVADENAVADLLVGYWVWAVSFVVTALGLWMLALGRQKSNAYITA